MNRSAIRRLRLHELEMLLSWLPPGGRVLEIGAGAGWQARALAERGFEVVAIDLAVSGYRRERVWPVQEYDGAHLPFEDQTFDCIFSSNVLEHVPHLEEFQHELQRVLRPGSLALHILPSATWRLWTTLLHVPDVLLRFAEKLRRIRRRARSPDADLTPAQAFTTALRALVSLPGTLFPKRHGERGNAWSEIYYFSRLHWKPFFRRGGWQMVAVQPNRLVYTGHQLVGDRLGIPWRTRLSRALGSSCNLYVLRWGPPR